MAAQAQRECMGTDDLTLVYRGRIVHSKEDTSLEILEDHLIGINKDGIISLLAPAADIAVREVLDGIRLGSRQIEFLDYSSHNSAFLIPGFIDTHLHAPQYLYSGTALDEPLMVWLTKYTFQAESRIDKDPEGLGRKVYGKLVQRLIESGTTMSALYGTITPTANLVLADVFHKAGLRALIGKLSMDQNSPDYYTENTESAIESATAFVKLMNATYDKPTLLPHQKLVHPCLTPRFIPTCSKELLVALAEIAAKGELDVQSHLSESNDEIAFTQSIWGKRTDTDIFKEVGLLTSKSLFAHCTHVNPIDLDLLKAHGSSVACCPLSNVYFSSKVFPMRSALAQDVKVGLGSDISGGYAIEIANSMRWAVGTSKLRESTRVEALLDISEDVLDSTSKTAMIEDKSKKLDITWRESIYLATLGGARALNRDAYLGNFRVGKSFDCQLIHILDGQDETGYESKGAPLASQLDLFEETYVEHGGKIPSEILLEKWWCNGTSKDRQRVYVAGKRLK